MSTLSLILRQVVNGLQSGSIYALVALGYSMVYGIIMLLNFAHGDIIMVGAYAAWFCLCGFAGNPILAIIAAIFVCVLLGVSIEKVAYAPLRQSPRLSLLITAIGVSYLLENLAQLVFGAGAKSMPSFMPTSTISIGSIDVSWTAIITLIVTAISMAALTLLVKKSKMGIRGYRCRSAHGHQCEPHHILHLRVGQRPRGHSLSAVLRSLSPGYPHHGLYAGP